MLRLVSFANVSRKYYRQTKDTRAHLHQQNGNSSPLMCCPHHRQAQRATGHNACHFIGEWRQYKAKQKLAPEAVIPAVPLSPPFCCLLTAAAVTVLSSLALLLPHATYTRMCGQASSHIHAEYLWIGWKHVIDVIANLWFIINWRDSRSAICLKCVVMPTDSDVYRIRTIKVPFIKYSALLLSIMQIQIHSWQSKTRNNLT